MKLWVCIEPKFVLFTSLNKLSFIHFCCKDEFGLLSCDHVMEAYEEILVQDWIVEILCISCVHLQLFIDGLIMVKQGHFLLNYDHLVLHNVMHAKSIDCLLSRQPWITFVITFYIRFTFRNKFSFNLILLVTRGNIISSFLFILPTSGGFTFKWLLNIVHELLPFSRLFPVEPDELTLMPLELNWSPKWKYIE